VVLEFLKAIFKPKTAEQEAVEAASIQSVEQMLLAGMTAPEAREGTMASVSAMLLGVAGPGHLTGLAVDGSTGREVEILLPAGRFHNLRIKFGLLVPDYLAEERWHKWAGQVLAREFKV
jgi:hypothetical protein